MNARKLKSRHRASAATPFALVLLSALFPRAAAADTIEQVLSYAYQNNPQLNAQRANQRGVDENVPQALSGYRPKVSATVSGGAQYTDSTATNTFLGVTTQTRTKATQYPYTLGATAVQTLYNGNQTANKTRAAESQVLAGREALRVLEEQVLLSAATAYMDVLRDFAVVEVQRNNVRVLEETLHQTNERYDAREVTKTDVAQAQGQLAAARFALQASESQLATSRSTYRRIIGIEANSLKPAAPVDRLAPGSLAAAVERGLTENPNVTAAMHGVDVAYLAVKINEGALFPVVTVQANAQKQYAPQPGITNQTTASVIGQVTIPIFQGGAEYSLIRQSQDTVAQQRFTLDQVRDQTRAGVVQAWSQLGAAKIQVEQAQAQITASEEALNGIREEARNGTRTTFDVLTAQQNLINARVSLLTSQHDRVVASYSLVSSVGALSPQALVLNTPVYDPTVHYDQVRDAWVGLRSPDSGQFAYAAADGKVADVKTTADGKAVQAAAQAPAAPPADENAAADDAEPDKKAEPMRAARAAPPAPAMKPATAAAMAPAAAPAKRAATAITPAAMTPAAKVAARSDPRLEAMAENMQPAPTSRTGKAGGARLLPGAERIMPTNGFATPLSAYR
jgi:outer membrane protein